LDSPFSRASWCLEKKKFDAPQISFHWKKPSLLCKNPTEALICFARSSAEE